MERVTNAVGRFSDLVRLFSLGLIAVMMTGIGLVLATGGRPEGFVCLLLGAGALIQIPKRLVNLYRDLTGHF